MRGVDVEVVGAGVAGLSLATLLAGAGLRVRVWEERYPGFGPSGRSAGLLVTILPDHLLGVALDSLGFYRSLDPGLVRESWALWVPGDPGCARRLLRLHEGLGLPWREARDPGGLVGHDYRLGGEEAFLIREYVVDTGRVVNALQQEAIRRGVELAEGRVEWRDGWLWAGGSVLGDTVVVAAGAWTGPLLGLDTLLSYRCQLASVEGPTPRLVIEDDRAGFYLVPVSENRFNIGDGSNALVDDPWEGFHPDLEDTLRVLEAYASRVPGAWESRIIQYWSAPCNTTATGDPAAYRVSSGLYVLTGFNGAGITLAPGTARLLARHLVDGAPLPSWATPRGRPEAPPREPFNICG